MEFPGFAVAPSSAATAASASYLWNLLAALCTGALCVSVPPIEFF